MTTETADHLMLKVPGIAVLGDDRIVIIHEPGKDDHVVDWTVTDRDERYCPEHQAVHVAVGYAAWDQSTGTHCLEDPATWVTVKRPIHHDRAAA